MDTGGTIDLPALEQKFREVMADLGMADLAVDLDHLKQYCQLTGHDYPAYAARDRLPLGYLMTLTAGQVSRMIMAFFTKFPGIVKGVIHTSSRVNVFAAFALSAGPYLETIEFKQLAEKAGRKGKYVVLDFEVALANAQGQKVVSDLHQFFLRV